MEAQPSLRTTANIIRFAEYRRQQVLSELIASVLGTLWLWAARRRMRQALGDIAEDDHLLADVGITRDQARREADKPFWRT